MNKFMPMLFSLALLSPGISAMASPGARWHDHAEIRIAASEAIATQWGAKGGRVDAVADDLDPRIRLAECGGPLEASVPFKTRNARRITALVRCPGPKPWKLHVPVRLTVIQPVVVVTRAMPRDSVLTPDDISLAEQDTGQLDYGYLSSIHDAVGQRLRRPLLAGDAVSPGDLEMPALVKRGQKVTLVAQSAGLKIRQAGIAREDGIRGQVIAVRNESSGREIEAIVRSAKSVEVLLQ